MDRMGGMREEALQWGLRWPAVTSWGISTKSWGFSKRFRGNVMGCSGIHWRHSQTNTVRYFMIFHAVSDISEYLHQPKAQNRSIWRGTTLVNYTNVLQKDTFNRSNIGQLTWEEWGNMWNGVPTKAKHVCGTGRFYPLVSLQTAIENGPWIVDLPMKHGDFPSFFVCLPEGTL